MRLLRSGAILLTCMLFWFCSEPEEPCCPVTEGPKSEELTDADRIGLIWSDEFGGTSLNQDIWTFDIGDGSLQGIPGWGNGEQQYYTDRPENLKIDQGFLKITAKKEDYEGSSYTSARIKTQGKKSVQFGRIVVRAKLPSGTGTWPAVWMLGDSYPKVSWPKCGEIDFVEQRGSNKNGLIGATHWFDEASGKRADYYREYSSPSFGTEFRKYTLEWTTSYIRMFVDGVKYFEMNINETMPFHDPFFLIMNLAMGGTLGGDIGTYFTSDEMWIDYIRIYEN